MRRILFIIGAMLICLVSHAGDIKHISTTYELVSDEPQSATDAKNVAFERARIKAMEEHFGLDVTGVTSVIQRSKTEGKTTHSTNDLYALRETAVRGEWIETIKEKMVEEPTYAKGFWRCKVYVEGKARSHTKNKAEVHYALINNEHDRVNRDQYYDGDDLYLRFNSPVKGALCVYLVDEDSQNAYCMLPYRSETGGCHAIEANNDYLLFDQSVDPTADEFTLNCQGSQEQNTIYIVFSPNSFSKANDRRSGKNWRNQEVPRQLTYKDFLTWLGKNQTNDEDMLVLTEVITIRQ